MPKKDVARVLGTQLPLGRTNKREAAVAERTSMLVEVVEYDFSVDAAAVDSVILLGTKLPANAVVYNALSDVEVDTAGGDITIQSGSTPVLTLSAGAVAGIIEPEVLSGSADAIKLAASEELSILIESGDMTAGKVKIALFFYVSK